MTEEQELLLCQAAKSDSLYLELLAKCHKYEDAYTRIKSQLSPDDQEILERYVSLCEELEYRRTCLAMAFADI